ncbi:unnamed protein product, partial [Musa acuminata subsp. burmannicoides]
MVSSVSGIIRPCGSSIASAQPMQKEEAEGKGKVHRWSISLCFVQPGSIPRILMASEQ